MIAHYARYATRAEARCCWGAPSHWPQVFIGLTLGGTWGFVLDNMLGTDEGFREYLWSPSGGMRYAMGTLATPRYGRFLVTILFDMFFTVILFKVSDEDSTPPCPCPWPTPCPCPCASMSTRACVHAQLPTPS